MRKKLLRIATRPATAKEEDNGGYLFVGVGLKDVNGEFALGRGFVYALHGGCPFYRVNFRYLIRWGWSASVPRRRLRSASYCE